MRISLLGVLLVACQPLRMSGSGPSISTSSSTSPTASTPPPVPPFCILKVHGAALETGDGKPVVLHGIDVPTIKVMEASGELPETRLRALAATGAQLVRLPITDEEFTAPFIPEKVLPFADLAKLLGIACWQTCCFSMRS